VLSCSRARVVGVSSVRVPICDHSTAELFSYTPPHPGASHQCLCVVCPCAVVWCLVVQGVRACCAVLCAVCLMCVFISSQLSSGLLSCLWMPCGHIPYAMVCDLESSCKLFAASASILHGANGQPCISLSRTVKKKNRLRRQTAQASPDGSAR